MLSDFDYELPASFIAQQPRNPRDASKLMVLGSEGIDHRIFSEIVDYFEAGDILVLNDTRVIPARLNCRKQTGGKAELLVMNLLGETRAKTKVQERIQKTSSTGPDGGIRLECLIKGKVREGTVLRLGSLPYSALVDEHIEEGRFYVRFIPDRDHTRGADLDPGSDKDIIGNDPAGEFISIMMEHGELPLPPYIKQPPDTLSRYQTVYSNPGGSIAAPTAGLHFTNELLKKLEAKGVRSCFITLHISYGTFKPVRERSVEDHKMDFEYYRVTEDAADLINEGRQNSCITAVGTTCVRTLESIFRNRSGAEACEGSTDLFIYPGYKFKAGINRMITNFHFSRSTLLMLVSAFAGRERILNAYEEAKQHGYRFYSFGDAMLIDGTGSSDR